MDVWFSLEIAVFGHRIFGGISSAGCPVKKNIGQKAQFRLPAQKASGNHKAGASNELS
jgi:hypothetical protein